MPRFRTYGKWIGALVILLALAQLGLPFFLQTRRMRSYLLAHLAKSFGRPVEARGFSVDILPFPRVEVEGVSIDENPAFGHEYFLRADRLTASVRWLGLLRGHFEFGTISLSRPSLILVRNEQGRWNLEGWLPPAQTKSPAPSIAYGPQSPVTSGNRLQKIEFDDGRINFKTGDEKRPFAFTNVSGSVEQMGPGRWQLRLEAQPWRSGVPLQSTGTLQVRGEVAGTSARLQPAEIQVHWEKVSIADLFRMIAGNDFGVRGAFSLDGNASIGKPDSGVPAPPGAWKFSLRAGAAKIHRWDLTERGDNPAVSLNLKGLWDVAAGEAHADTLTLELPHSHFAGAARLRTAGMSDWNLRIEDSGIQAEDLLAWYRAFQPDVAETLDARQLFKASFALHGFPLSWQDVQISSAAGELRVPEFARPFHIGPVFGAAHNNFFELFPVQVSVESARKETPGKPEKNSAKTGVATAPAGQLEIRFRDDFIAGKGALRVTGKLNEINDFFKAAAAFGRTLNRGWEITGGAAGSVTREWEHGVANGRWSGALDLTKAQLQAAGLNLPLKLDEARFEWKNGRRNATIARASAFGAIWSGSISDVPALDDSAGSNWKFQLHADHLDAADLDLWFGPRARPNWLQRLLPSLLGKSDANGKPSELLRRVTAEGELEADSLAIEKIKLARARAHLAFHDLHLEVRDAEAEWAGGTARGNVSAVFSVPPKYEISAEVDRASLSELPWSAHWAEHWSGAASGKLHLKTSGVGRDALVSQLTGSGELSLNSVELRGWDVGTSMDTGTLHTGTSRWAAGEGEFTIANRAVSFDSLTLENPHAKTRLDGAIDFSQQLQLTFAPAPIEKRAAKSTAAPRLFQLRGPLEKPVAAVEITPVAQARSQQ
ncbi:MAG TPA: AsmA family protein [Candidatus Acidoferrum sp.]|nr:AsmA family protein [Candidatus Acidoferrum sp.]